MKAIRGATTILKDTPEEIRGAVKELLNEICLKNALNKEDILCILFSNTADIRSFYPAKAARECGYTAASLFSSAEPEIDGALPLCIRVMLFVETSASVKHVYLRNAANLRKDLQKYRACALKAISMGVDVQDNIAVNALMQSLNLEIVYQDGTQHTILDGKDVSEDIRRPEVSMAASKISALQCVREKMVEMQRRIASEQSCVLDGRDIGSFVLPKAEFKFYVTATSEVRAKRRYDELKAKGFQVDLKALQKEIEERDRNDSTREFSPLKQAEDAVLVDTSGLSVDEVVQTICSKIQEKV